jgi:D-amino-acid oxidase
MKKRVAIIGAGVSGLTSSVLFAERGYGTTIFAEESGIRTTSGAAAAIWYPYDAEPTDKVIAWALETYNVFIDLSRNPRSGVSMIELRNFSRAGEIEIPAWARSLGARPLRSVAAGLRPASRRAQRDGYSVVDKIPPAFTSGFALNVPLTDTTRYLDYLKERLTSAGGSINDNVRFEKLEDVSRDFDLVVNCSGIGARTLVRDADLEAHRGQVAIVPKLTLPYAIVCDDPPLMYAIPRANDCVFGGTNELSYDRTIDSVSTSRIVAECSRALDIDQPKVLCERVGLRPFRKSGVRVETDRLRDGRVVIHNYGHGGAGFTLSWGCAANVLALAGAALTRPNE